MTRKKLIAVAMLVAGFAIFWAGFGCGMLRSHEQYATLLRDYREMTHWYAKRLGWEIKADGSIYVPAGKEGRR